MSATLKYPWKVWFKRKRYILLKGKHFHCQPHSMAQLVRNQAHRRNRRVSISIDGDEVTITNL